MINRILSLEKRLFVIAAVVFFLEEFMTVGLRISSAGYHWICSLLLVCVSLLYCFIKSKREGISGKMLLGNQRPLIIGILILMLLYPFIIHALEILLISLDGNLFQFDRLLMEPVSIGNMYLSTCMYYAFFHPQTYFYVAMTYLLEALFQKSVVKKPAVAVS